LLKNAEKTAEGLRTKLKQERKAIDEKDSTIHTKERKILTLKRRTQELEKFKFVLDEKIQDLRREIAPKEQEIKNLRKKTKEMDEKLK